MRRTKIVATIGPASDSEDMLRDLIGAGVNVARLNFSHGSHAEHGRKIQLIRQIAQDLDRPVAILQDLSGPKIRIGSIAAGSVTLNAGQRFVLTSRPVDGDAEVVSVSYKSLPREVHPGNAILLNDGALELSVVETTDTDIVCQVTVGGELSSRKGVTLPSGSVNTPSLTDKDRDDLAFGIQQGVDFVALSFVRSAKDIAAAREVIAARGRDIPLIAKIEKHEALANIDEIIAVADGLMIARGDLGVETPIERIPQAQKMLIRRANQAAIPVITATQMLKSMVSNPRPTRAEVTDIANAILDGSDAVMLSEESAVGDYPLEAVRVMDRVIRSSEESFPFDEWPQRFSRQAPGRASEQQSVASAACRLAGDCAVAAIITCTQSGSTTRQVARYRPFQPILAMTPDEATYRQLALTWGALPLHIGKADSTDEMELQALAESHVRGLVPDGGRVVITAGFPLHQAGTTNLIKLATVTAPGHHA